MKKNYLIKYKVYSSIDVVLRQGTMRVRNKANEFTAKVGLESHLRKIVPAFNRLEVESCIEEKKILEDVSEIFEGVFRDILKTK